MPAVNSSVSTPTSSTAISVTIAMPLYNVAPYVVRSLCSALEQDFALPYEVLIIDDCSTDGSLEVVRQLLTSHHRQSLVRIVSHPRNLGLGPARNTAIREARGEYLLFLDSDDWLLPDCLSHLYSLAQSHQADVVAGSTLEVKDGIERPRYTLLDEVCRHPAAGLQLLLNGSFLNIEVWNKLLRLDFVRSHQLEAEHRIIEDSVFDFRLRAEAGCIVTSSHPTLCYNLRPGSILSELSARPASDEAVETYCHIMQRLQQLIRERYAQLPGIYDLYLLRFFYTRLSLRRIQLSDTQRSYVDRELRDALRFVPSLRLLRLGISRYSLLVTRLFGYHWRIFYHIYDRRNDAPHKQVARLFDSR